MIYSSPRAADEDRPANRPFSRDREVSTGEMVERTRTFRVASDGPIEVELRASLLLDEEGVALGGVRSMPALVLLDINMPGMSGMEVLEHTRADPAFETFRSSAC